MSFKRPCKYGGAGFTLIEMIMVIVITGIIASMVGIFIARPVQGYTDSVRRAILTDAADVTLRQVSREVRLALPNSLRMTQAVSGGATWNFIEFIPTSTGGRYRDSGDGSVGVSGTNTSSFLDFTNTANVDFDVLGGLSSSINTIAVGDYVVVYNLGQSYVPADAYQLNNCASAPGCNIAQIASVGGTALSTIRLTNNRFAAEVPPLPSPNARFQVVPFATRAVTYACIDTGSGGAPASMMRYWGYGLNPTQPTVFASGSSALVVRNATCTATYFQNVLERNGLLYLNLRITASGETIEVFDQIHVDNTP